MAFDDPAAMIDPSLAAAMMGGGMLGGGYGGAVMLPQLAAAYQRDPRTALVRSIMGISQQSLAQPTSSKFGALAKALTGGVGGLSSAMLDRDYQEKNTQAQGDLSNALAAMQGTPASTGADGQPVAAVPGDYAAGMRILGHSPYFAGTALQSGLTMAQTQAKAKIELQNELAKTGKQLMPDGSIALIPGAPQATRVMSAADKGGGKAGELEAQATGEPAVINATSGPKAAAAAAEEAAKNPALIARAGGTAAITAPIDVKKAIDIEAGTLGSKEQLARTRAGAEAQGAQATQRQKYGLDYGGDVPGAPGFAPATAAGVKATGVPAPGAGTGSLQPAVPAAPAQGATGAAAAPTLPAAPPPGGPTAPEIGASPSNSAAPAALPTNQHLNYAGKPYQTTLPPVSDQAQIPTAGKQLEAAYTKWQADQGDWQKAVAPAQQAEQRLQTIASTFKDIQTGAFVTDKARGAAALQALGLPSSLLADPSKAQIALHENYIETLQALKASNPRFTQAEFKGLAANKENPDLQPEANLQMLAEDIGTLRQMRDIAGDWPAAQKSGWRDTSSFESSWMAHNPVSRYVQQVRDEIGPLKGMAGAAGATPPASAAHKEGDTFTNKATGERLIFKGGTYVPLTGQ